MPYDSMKNGKRQAGDYSLGQAWDYSLGADLEDGKRDWAGKRCRCKLLADCYKRIGKPMKSQRVENCGTMLVFGLEVESMSKHLYYANFCKDRLCPLCSWRRSLKAFVGLSASMNETISRAAADGYEVQPIFLTVTVENVPGDELRATIDLLADGWKRMLNSKKFKRLFEYGWFRCFEVTYNKEKDNYHPHIHVLLLPTREYFWGKDYMDHDAWVARWQKAARLPYVPIVNIKAAVHGKSREKAALELTKYVVKDKEMLYAKDPELTDKVVSVLSDALAGRRLYAYGGNLKKVAAELGADKEDGDLVHVDQDAVVEDVAVIYLVYHWGIGYRYRLSLATPDKGVIDTLTGLARMRGDKVDLDVELARERLKQKFGE